MIDAARQWPGMVAIWLLLACIAIALRLPDLGNPLIDIDEQMYLLVGDRMWGGALPYVDIWDRKPVGLFLIYAGARGFGGDPWLGYQLAALAATIATAGVIALFARRVGPPLAGLAAGSIYLAWVELLGGRGGQSPVFYNLPMAIAALLVWQCCTDAAPARVRTRGMAAMMLVGLALQIKPTVVFEGCFFGVALVVSHWRLTQRPGEVIACAIGLVTIALLPTLAAFAAYAAAGHGDAWWFANVQSIFLRRVNPHAPLADRLIGLSLSLLVPFALAMLAAVRQRGTSRLFLGGWLAVALAGLLAIPPFFNHYALPLLVPVAVLAGVSAARSRVLAAAVAAAAIALLIFSGYPHRGETRTARAQVVATAATIDRYRHGGCVFLFQAPPILYQATGSCLPTRYAFGPHLTFASESGAIGIDPAVEVRRILATAPPVIVTSIARGDVNTATFSLVSAALRDRYRPVGRGLGSTIYARTAGPVTGTPRRGSNAAAPR